MQRSRGGEGHWVQLLRHFLVIGGTAPLRAAEGGDHHYEAEAEGAVMDEDEPLPVGCVQGLVGLGQGGGVGLLCGEPDHKHDGVFDEDQHRVHCVREPCRHLRSVWQLLWVIISI